MIPHQPGMPLAIITDEAARRAVARDYGGYVQRVPRGVVRPRALEEVVAAVQYAARHGIPLAARGAGHSTRGQAQVEDGLVLDMRALAGVLEVADDSILVAGGTLWRAVAEAALARGRTFPVFTDYLTTTVGGTLAVGGVGSRTWRLGAQTDHVLELEVVTGRGEVVVCSAARHADLFDAVRAGLGQFGIVTRARLALIAAPRHVHYHRALYSDFDTFYGTLLAHVDALAYDAVQGFALANTPEALTGQLGPAAGALEVPQDAGAWLFCIETVSLRNDATDLAATAPAARDWLPGGYVAHELPYLAYLDRLAAAQEALTQAGLWQLPHPMVDLLIPASAAAAFLREEMAALDPAEVAGPVLIYPYQRAPLRTPFLRLPDEARVVLFGLMRTTLPPTPEHVQRQVADNRRLYERMRDSGGTYYPIDSVPMDPADWQRHFGEQWPAFAAAKARYDPHYLLNPGQGVFAP